MRLVSLAPSFTETLQALGAGADLAAVSDHCPEAAGAARVGPPKALRLAEIRALSPEIVLADQNENRPEELRALAKDLRVEIFDVRSVQAAIDAAARLGRLAGRHAEARALEEEIGRAWRENREELAGAEPVRTLILLWPQPYLTVNFDTYASRLVEASGGRNVFHEDPLREFPVELEDMIEKNPEIVLLPKDPYPFRSRHAAALRQYRVFSKIPVKLVDGQFFSHFGPATARALRTLKAVIAEAAESRA